MRVHLRGRKPGGCRVAIGGTALLKRGALSLQLVVTAAGGQDWAACHARKYAHGATLRLETGADFSWKALRAAVF